MRFFLFLPRVSEVKNTHETRLEYHISYPIPFVKETARGSSSSDHGVKKHVVGPMRKFKHWPRDESIHRPSLLIQPLHTDCASFYARSDRAPLSCFSDSCTFCFCRVYHTLQRRGRGHSRGQARARTLIIRSPSPSIWVIIHLCVLLLDAPAPLCHKKYELWFRTGSNDGSSKALDSRAGPPLRKKRSRTKETA